MTALKEFATSRAVASQATPFDLDAQRIAERQYLQPGDGDIHGMFARVARWAASLEPTETRSTLETSFYRLMCEKHFSPGGRILAGAGSAHGNVLNCFVQGATAHHAGGFRGVMEVVKKLGLITKVGGGNGVNLDALSRKPNERLAIQGRVYLSSDHTDVEHFIRGAMRPSNNITGEHVTYPLRHWKRHVYRLLSAELRELAALHGVKCQDHAPTHPNLIAVSDSLEAILDSGAAVCERALGGYEPLLDLSELRSEGKPIHGSGGTASGPVSFLIEIFEHALEWVNSGGIHSGPVGALRHLYAPVLRAVKQGGSRRGAGMATLGIEHPDVLDFLTAKDLDREQREGDISSFNVSLLVSDAFMAALGADGLWPVLPNAVPGKYELMVLDGPYRGWDSNWAAKVRVQEAAKAAHGTDHDAVVSVPVFGGGIPATWLWEEIARHAWGSGEPGMIFIDTVNDKSALKNLGERYTIRATNPCGEINLTVGEPCDLGALNLGTYVREQQFDFTGFKNDIVDAVRFLDNVLDLNTFVLEDNRTASQNLRRIGLGVMGLADALIKLGLRYDSQPGREAVANIMRCLRDHAIRASENLALERGVYPLYTINANAIPHPPRRHVALLTVAPTGTTSMLMGASSGIEPVFSPFVYRNIGGQYVPMIAPLFKELLEQYPPSSGFSDAQGWNWEAVTSAIANNHGSVVGLEFVPTAIQQVFVCAHDIAPLDHVAMQATIQTAFDGYGYAANSLSKTINLSNHATVDDVKDAYGAAYHGGCKGITVYRDGSRDAQVLNTGLEVKPSEGDAPQPARELELPAPIPPTVTSERRKPFFTRPERLTGATDMVKLSELAQGGKRTFLVTVNSAPSGPVELVLVSGRAGDEANADSEALGRLTSIALQHGVPPEAIVKTLRGINGGLYGTYNQRLVASKADLIAIALEQSLASSASPAHHQPHAESIPALRGGAPELTNATTATPAPLAVEGATRCTKCHNISVVRHDGCQTCLICHDSRCG